MGIKICQKCNTACEDTTNFCFRCGCDIRNLPVIPVHTSTVNDVAKYPPTQPNFNETYNVAANNRDNTVNTDNTDYSQPYVKDTRLCCYRCGSTNFVYIGSETIGQRNAQYKTRTSINLNPLHPLTVYNSKQVMTDKGSKGYNIEQYRCLDCGCKQTNRQLSHRYKFDKEYQEQQKAKNKKADTIIKIIGFIWSIIGIIFMIYLETQK